MSENRFINRKHRQKPFWVGNNIRENRTTSEPSAVIQIEDLNGGFLTSRLTTAQRDAIIDPATAVFIWNTDTAQFEFWNGTIWDTIGGGGGGAVSSVHGRSGNVIAAPGDYTAAQITSAPSGNLAAVDVQGALDELQGDIDGINTTVSTLGASAVANTPSGNLIATTVQGAVDELQGDIDGLTATAPSAAEKTSLTNIEAMGNGMMVKTGTGTYQPRSMLASTAAGSEGISIINPAGVTGNPEFGLDINGLTANASALGADELVLYDTTNGSNRKITAANLLAGTDNFANADLTVAAARTHDFSGQNLTFDSSGSAAGQFQVNMDDGGTGTGLLTVTATTASIGNSEASVNAVGSGLNITLSAGADIQLNGAVGGAGQAIIGQGAGNINVWGYTTEVSDADNDTFVRVDDAAGTDADTILGNAGGVNVMTLTDTASDISTTAGWTVANNDTNVGIGLAGSAIGVRGQVVGLDTLTFANYVADVGAGAFTSGAGWIDTATGENMGVSTSATSTNIQWGDAAGTGNTTAVSINRGTHQVQIVADGRSVANFDYDGTRSIVGLDTVETLAGRTTQLRFFELDPGGDYVSFRAPDSIPTTTDFVLPSADGNAGEVLTTDGSGNLRFDVAILPIVAEVSVATTATLNTILPVNVTGAAVTITLPAGAVTGDRITVSDSRGNSSINNITVDVNTTNGYNLHGSANDYLMNVDAATVTFVYVNAAVGWITQK